MSKPKLTNEELGQRRWRALRGISVRVSQDPESPDYDRFIEFKEGRVMRGAPEHTNWRWLVDEGYIEEVPDSRFPIPDSDDESQPAVEPEPEPEPARDPIFEELLSRPEAAEEVPHGE